MADSLNSYTPAFYMAGAVVLAGACIPFMLLCTKKRDPGREPWVVAYDQSGEIDNDPDWRSSAVLTIEERATWLKFLKQAPCVIMYFVEKNEMNK